MTAGDTEPPTTTGGSVHLRGLRGCRRLPAQQAPGCPPHRDRGGPCGQGRRREPKIQPRNERSLAMTTAAEIAVLLRAHAEMLLETADMLDPGGTLAQLQVEANEFYAPWGYKADGTPKAKPGRKPTTQ